MKTKKLHICIVSFLITLIIVALPLLASCSSTTATPSRLTVGMANTTPHLNLLIPKGQHLPYRRLMYEPLLNIEADGSLSPRLAKSWSWDLATKTWTFNLRNDVKWHDGEPFTSADVKATYDLAMELGGMYKQTWAGDVATDGCTIVDDHTIQFTLKEAYEWWPSNFREERSDIIPAHIWLEKDLDEWLNMDNPIGTGPFKYKEGDWLTYSLFEKNTDYWGGAPKIDEVLLKEYANLEAEILAFKAGEIDAISGKTMRNPASIATLLADPAIEVALNDQNRYDQLRVNMYHYPNNVTNFRQALSYAIDREEICEVVYHNYASPAPQVPYVPSALQNTDAIVWPGADMTDAERIAEANLLLDGLGYVDTADEGTTRNGPMGADGVTGDLEFTLLTGTISSHVRAAEIVQKNMEDIGIKVNHQTMSFSALFAKIKNQASDWDWYLGGHGQPISWDAGFAGYFNDPDDWSSTFIAGPIGFNEPVLQGKMTESLTASGAARAALIAEIQVLWAAYLPMIPVHTTNTAAVYRTDNLTGWDLEAQAGPPPSALEPLHYRNLLKLKPAE